MTTIYRVQRIAPEGEKRRVYSPSKTRVYEGVAGVRAFIKANQTSRFKIQKIEGEWEDLTLEDLERATGETYG